MDHLGAKPAILVVKNRAIRHKAAIMGVTAIATSIIRQVLTAPKRS